MGNAGERNAWFCPECRGLTIVKHIDAGVTPTMLRCRRAGLDAEENPCKGIATSLWYPPESFWGLIDPPGKPDRRGTFHPTELYDWEWFAANDAQLAGTEALSIRKRTDKADIICAAALASSDSGEEGLRALAALAVEESEGRLVCPTCLSQRTFGCRDRFHQPQGGER